MFLEFINFLVGKILFFCGSIKGDCFPKPLSQEDEKYYLATVINAYRRAIDEYYKIGSSYKNNPLYQAELKKTFHRAFTTAYAFGKNDDTVNYENSQSTGNSLFIASVLGYDNDAGYME